jgi:endonuclease/exonuclease/phosphatase family metal-dependent hydrolase
MNAHLVRTAGLVVLLSLAAPGADAQTTGGFSTLTYNVAGLLEPFSGGNPAVNTPIISCLIRAFHVVQVQEDFNYHAALYDSCDDHPFRSPTSGGMGFGDGLNQLSDFPYSDFGRIEWDACDGVDCLTPKGFTLARTQLAPGVHVDFYNLHMQAETSEPALAARRDNVLQLAEYIEANSAGNAVIVMGDTNTRYTRTGDNIRELLKRGFTDVWVQRLRGGGVPALGAAALTACEPSATNANCEVVDKVFVRDNGYVGIAATQYRVEDQAFVDSAGADLSDHFPISAAWSFALPANRRMSDPFGGPHGTSFNDIALLPANPVIATLAIRTGARVDQVGATLSNGYVLVHGGGGGTLRTLALGSTEYVRSVQLCQGQFGGRTRIFSVRFTTSTNRVLSGGTTTSSCTTHTAPTNWQIVGFHGRAGDNVDKLGVIYAPRQAGSPPGPASYVSIVNRASGLCLDVWNAAMAPGTNVAQWTCSGANWQKWSYDATTGLIRSRHDPRFCLDNTGSFDDGANIMIWPCTGNANQRFDVDTAGGVIRMRTWPTQVVDAVGTAPGNDVITWTNWGGTNQRWNFAP